MEPRVGTLGESAELRLIVELGAQLRAGSKLERIRRWARSINLLA
jgi:hypothetical protein